MTSTHVLFLRLFPPSLRALALAIYSFPLIWHELSRVVPYRQRRWQPVRSVGSVGSDFVLSVAVLLVLASSANLGGRLPEGRRPESAGGLRAKAGSAMVSRVVREPPLRKADLLMVRVVR